MSAQDRTAAQDPPREPATASSGEDEAEATLVEVGEGEEEASQPPELDAETRARRDAALRHVRKLGDPALRAKAVPVDRFDAALQAEVQQMGELMHDALGVGLAATQLGVLHRVLVYKAYLDDPLTALVNPVLDWTSDELEMGEEGCLSLPGVHVEVERPLRVRVKARDETGKKLKIEAEGLEARVIQHEIDHLDGTLILDRISREQRKEAMRAMREATEAGDGAPSARREQTREANAEGSAAEGAGAQESSDNAA